MSGFIDWLERLNESDSKVRAVLRRSLAFDPGQHIQAFPYVEPFLKGEESRGRREMHYLVAALWAAHWREGQPAEKVSLAVAVALHDRQRRDALPAKERSKPTSTERRFISLLDADEEQLPHRLRQMVALLGEQAIDFDALLSALVSWGKHSKPTQNTWGREFYRTLDRTTDQTTEAAMETLE